MLKTFLPLFAMTFFIVLFIVLMQFLWKYIDDLVGKGLGIGVLGELFFYAAVSMVPMALPLAILLASLMTFGNLGEKFELTAIKASGISLVRAMAPLIVTVGMIAVGAFFFQNYVLPKAQVKMWTLLFSMRQKSPELEIPEDVFYDQIPGFNLYVKQKDRETGMLRGVMIYDVSNGGDNATIITSDSARLAFTPDMRFLYLHLWKGEQFENLRDQNNRRSGINTPFRRETFVDKEVLIPFDANFNRLDEEGMRKQYVGKNMQELLHTMDSISVRIDSLGRTILPSLRRQELTIVDKGRVVPSSAAESASLLGRADTIGSKAGDDKELASEVAPIRMDTLIASLPDLAQGEVYGNALSLVQRRRDQLTFRAQMMSDEKRTLRRNDIELIKKFTLSVACVIFFFIGAPLGAIIRKGGLGTPLVISVLLFVVYYIIDNTGYKMARDGKIEVWFGMWLSTFILAPLGIYVTWRAMNDAAVVDVDRYKAFFRRLAGVRQHRNVASKEVIINDISVAEAIDRLSALADHADALEASLASAPGYGRYWRVGFDRTAIAEFGAEIDRVVDYLHDSRDPQVVGMLSDFPIVSGRRIFHPSAVNWQQRCLMIFLPVGLPVWIAALRARRQLIADCRMTAKRARLLIERLSE